MVELQNYKDMLLLAPILIAIIVSPYVGSYSSLVTAGAFGSVFVYGFATPWYVEKEAAEMNVIRATIRSDFSYPGNHVLQFFYKSTPQSFAIFPADKWGNTWRTIITLVPPFPKHPRYGQIRKLKLKHDMEFNKLFPGKDKGEINFKSNAVKHTHMDLATLDEIYYGRHIPTPENYKETPVFRVVEATGTYPHQNGNDVQAPIMRATSRRVEASQ